MQEEKTPVQKEQTDTCKTNAQENTYNPVQGRLEDKLSDILWAKSA